MIKKLFFFFLGLLLNVKTISQVSLISGYTKPQNVQINIEGGYWANNPIFSPNGNYIAFSASHTLFVLEFKSGELVIKIPFAVPVKFSNKGECLYFFDTRKENFLNKWDLKTNQLENQYPIKYNYTPSPLYDLNNNQMAIISANTVLLWDLDSAKIMDTISTDINRMNSVSYSFDGKKLAVGESQGSIKIYDTQSGEKIKEIKKLNTRLTQLKFHPNNNIIGFVDQKLLKIYSLDEDKLLHTIRDDFRNGSSFEFSKNGKFVVTSTNSITKVWSVRTGHLRNKYNIKSQTFSFDSTGKLLAIGGMKGLTIIDLEKDQELFSYAIFGNGDAEVIYTPDGLIDGNDLGIQYVEFHEGGTVFSSTNHPQRKIPKLIAAIFNGEIEEYRSNLNIKSKQSTKKINRTGKDQALLFAIQDYEHLEDLKNPIKDARAIKEELEDAYNFEVDLVENPTKEQILDKINEYRNKIYAQDEQLLILFSGHGDFRTETNTGYFVTKDSKSTESNKYRTSYLSYPTLREELNSIPCEHTLVTIDACYSGTFDNGIAKQKGDRLGERPGEDDKTTERENFVKKTLKKKSTLFISSGGKERTSDGINHSPFAKQFLEALRSEGEEDKVLTINELMTYMEAATPKPVSGEFGESQSKDSFLFIVQ